MTGIYRSCNLFLNTIPASSGKTELIGCQFIKIIGIAPEKCTPNNGVHGLLKAAVKVPPVFFFNSFLLFFSLRSRTTLIVEGNFVKTHETGSGEGSEKRIDEKKLHSKINYRFCGGEDFSSNFVTVSFSSREKVF